MIQIYKKSLRGDTVRWPFVVTYKRVPYAIQGGDTVNAIVKRKPSDPDSAAVVPKSSIVITVLNQTTNPGEIEVVMSADITDGITPGHYYIDIQLTKGGLSPVEVFTPIRVMWEFDPDVLRAR